MKNKRLTFMSKIEEELFEIETLGRRPAKYI